MIITLLNKVQAMSVKVLNYFSKLSQQKSSLLFAKYMNMPIT